MIREDDDEVEELPMDESGDYMPENYQQFEGQGASNEPSTSDGRSSGSFTYEDLMNILGSRYKPRERQQQQETKPVERAQYVIPHRQVTPHPRLPAYYPEPPPKMAKKSNPKVRSSPEGALKVTCTLEELNEAFKERYPNVGPTGGPRHENSLFLTTQKFYLLREYVVSDVLNLNDVAKFLKLPKRRLYDITNVLEGINLVEKIGKNSVRFTGGAGETEEAAELKNHIDVLKKQEDNLDNLLKSCASFYAQVTSSPADRRYAYVKRSDIRLMDMETEMTSVAIKTNRQTFKAIEVQVADPQEGRYQMIAKNNISEPMDAFLCLQGSENYASFEPADNGQFKLEQQHRQQQQQMMMMEEYEYAVENAGNEPSTSQQPGVVYFNDPNQHLLRDVKEEVVEIKQEISEDIFNGMLSECSETADISYISSNSDEHYNIPFPRPDIQQQGTIADSPLKILFNESILEFERRQAEEQSDGSFLQLPTFNSAIRPFGEDEKDLGCIDIFNENF